MLWITSLIVPFRCKLRSYRHISSCGLSNRTRFEIGHIIENIVLLASTERVYSGTQNLLNITNANSCLIPLYFIMLMRVRGDLAFAVKLHGERMTYCF